MVEGVGEQSVLRGWHRAAVTQAGCHYSGGNWKRECHTPCVALGMSTDG